MSTCHACGWEAFASASLTFLGVPTAQKIIPFLNTEIHINQKYRYHWYSYQKYDLKMPKSSPAFGLGGRGGGGMAAPKVFAKYLKNGLTNLHETLSLLRPIHRSSFNIKSLMIAHLFLPW